MKERTFLRSSLLQRKFVFPIGKERNLKLQKEHHLVLYLVRRVQLQPVVNKHLVQTSSLLVVTVVIQRIVRVRVADKSRLLKVHNAGKVSPRHWVVRHAACLVGNKRTMLIQQTSEARASGATLKREQGGEMSQPHCKTMSSSNTT